MTPPALHAPTPIVALAAAPIPFSQDRVLASGPSSAWLEGPRWPPSGPAALPPILAPITRFIEQD